MSLCSTALFPFPYFKVSGKMVVSPLTQQTSTGMTTAEMILQHSMSESCWTFMKEHCHSAKPQSVAAYIFSICKERQNKHKQNKLQLHSMTCYSDKKCTFIFHSLTVLFEILVLILSKPMYILGTCSISYILSIWSTRLQAAISDCRFSHAYSHTPLA